MDTWSKASRFIILIPHRDALKALEEYKKKLFSVGFTGAYSFPMAAPLASVSRFFNREELKELAGNIRSLTNGNNGKILCPESAGTNFATEKTKPREDKPRRARSNTEEKIENPKLSVRTAKLRETLCNSVVYSFGFPLNLPAEEALFPKTAREKILNIFSPPILCAAILGSDENPAFEEAPSLSFRAASVANMAIRPLDCGARPYSFEWKIGPPIWLPKYKGD